MKEEQVETVEAMESTTAPTTSNVSLGIYLRRKRVLRGLTQSNVASKLGYGSPQFISNIERGIANVPLKSLRRIIDLYQVPPLEVLDVLMSDKKRYWCQQLGIGSTDISMETKSETTLRATVGENVGEEENNMNSSSFSSTNG